MKLWTMIRNAVAGGALLACYPGYSGPPPGTAGQLGNGRFFYSEGCDGGDCLGSVPVSVAVGGEFSLTFSQNGAAAAVIVPAAPALSDFSSSVRDGFIIKASGQNAFLAVSGSDVVDFLHVRGVKIDHFRIVEVSSSGDASDAGSSVDAGSDAGTRDGGAADAGDSDGGMPDDGGEPLDGGTPDSGVDAGPPPPQLVIGMSPYVEAVPVDTSDVRLPGVLSYQWTSSRPDVAAVFSGGPYATISPVAVGTTNISVSAGGTKTSFDVTVRMVTP
jgi:hypothetical protein